MRAVIISGGRVADYAYIKQQIKAGDTIICADSGYNHAKKMKLQTSVIIGDFDSIGSIPQDIATIKYPPAKDLTDTEIAIEYARDKGFKDFLLLAATGGRMDHSLTNILLLKGFLERGETAVIIDEHNKIMLTDTQLQLHETPGSIVSLVPLADCTGVCTENLEYPLQDANLYVGKGIGVSNVMQKAGATVSLQKGLLLVIVARD